MKKILIIVFIINNLTSSAQFYNKLNNVFLPKENTETTFSDDFAYLQTWLQTATSRLFMSNMQTSMSTSGTAVFFGLDIIPRGNFSNQIFNSGVSFNFIGKPTKDIVKIPLTFNGKTQVDGNPKKASGYLQIYSDKIFLEFARSILIPLQKDTKLETDSNVTSQFIISGIDYKIDEHEASFIFNGKFNNDIKTSSDRAIYRHVETVKCLFTKNNLKLIVINKDQVKGAVEKTILDMALIK